MRVMMSSHSKEGVLLLIAAGAATYFALSQRRQSPAAAKSKVLLSRRQIKDGAAAKIQARFRGKRHRVWHLKQVGKRVLSATAMHSKARKRDARQIFDEMDVDHNGTVTREEASAWLSNNSEWAEAIGISSSIDAFLAHVDEDESGEISRAEFSAWWGRLQSTSMPTGASIKVLDGPLLSKALRSTRSDSCPSVMREKSMLDPANTSSGYGLVRFLAHNKYLYGCLERGFLHSHITAERLLCTDVAADAKWFVRPESSLRYEFADGSTSGNFLLQLDGFVSPAEARRLIAVGCAIKKRSLGEHAPEEEGASGGEAKPPESAETILPSRFGSANALTRFGAIAFYQAYPTAWTLLERARPWLPQFIVDGEKRWKLRSCNPRVRLVHYGDSQGFGMHFDGYRWCLESERDELGLPFTSMRKHNQPGHEDDGLHSFLTLNLYLNDATDATTTFGGGALAVHSAEPPGSTRSHSSWYDDGSELTERERVVFGEGPYQWHCGERLPVVPRAGRMLIFGQGRNAGLAHEAQAIACDHGRMQDMKWIMRSDVCYSLVKPKA